MFDLIGDLYKHEGFFVGTMDLVLTVTFFISVIALISPETKNKAPWILGVAIPLIRVFGLL